MAPLTCKVSAIVTAPFRIENRYTSVVSGCASSGRISKICGCVAVAGSANKGRASAALLAVFEIDITFSGKVFSIYGKLNSIVKLLAYIISVKYLLNAFFTLCIKRHE